MTRRLLSFLAITACALAAATALLWASSVGEHNRCSRLDPASAAAAAYGCSR